MKIAFVSDTHGFEGSLKIPKCDVLVHCGDVCPAFGELSAIDNIAYWFENLKQVGEVILVAGNHDTNFISRPEQSKFIIKKGCHYLQNEELVIDGITFFGMSFLDIIREYDVKSLLIPDFISEEVDKRRKYYEMIPEYTDVLITHQPPDLPPYSCTTDGFNLGCPILKEAVDRIKPKIHAFGHVHTGYGLKSGWPTTYINASNGYENNIVQTVSLQ